MCWHCPAFLLVGARRTSPPPQHRSYPSSSAKAHLGVSYFSMVTTVGTPQDVTAQEIRLESFFPADEATERHRWA